jgi:hypothetical protein
MKHQTCGIALLLLLALFCCTPAFAKTEWPLQYREYEAIPFVGASFISDFHFSTPVVGNGQVSSRTVRMSFDPGPSIGARVHQNVGDYCGVALEYSFAAQRLHFTNLAPNIQNLSMNSFIHHFSWDVYSMPLPRTKRFRPYGGGGVGAVGYVPGGKSDALEKGVELHSSWSFLVDLGGGFKYLVSDRFALTLDVKDRISTVPSYGLPKSARIVNGVFQPGMRRHGFLQNWQVNLGFSFQWDEFD